MCDPSRHRLPIVIIVVVHHQTLITIQSFIPFIIQKSKKYKRILIKFLHRRHRSEKYNRIHTSLSFRKILLHICMESWMGHAKKMRFPIKYLWVQFDCSHSLMLSISRNLTPVNKNRGRTPQSPIQLSIGIVYDQSTMFSTTWPLWLQSYLSGKYCLTYEKNAFH